MTVLVSGASGQLGTVLLPRLAQAGHDVRAMSRRVRSDNGWVAADLATGDGLAEAVRDVDAVVHLASAPAKGRQTDIEGTRRLIAASAQAGVRHLLYVSIVGVDRVPLSYYRTKLAAEEVVRSGAVPWTILRVTQFYTLIDQLLRAATRLGPLIGDRAVMARAVDLGDVAGRLVDGLGTGPGAIQEFGGPEVMRFDEAACRWQHARGTSRPVLPIRIPGRIGRELRAGALTTTAQPRGVRTWDEFLIERYGPSH
jgi:uncharacterized protein YbjT (DUF2867 family)